MIILRKIFSSKAQKARRAKWEIETGAQTRPGTEKIMKEYIDDTAKYIKKTAKKAGINLSKEEFSVMCNFYFSDIVGYISTECAFSSYKNARKVIEDNFGYLMK